MNMAAISQAQPDAEIAGMTARLVDLAGRLAEMLTRETALVRAMRIKEIGPLQDAKTALTEQYQTAFKSLTSAHDGKSLPAAIKEQLAVSGQLLAAAVADNELALRVGKVATETLIGSIIAAVKEQKKSGRSYAPRSITPRYTFMTAAAVDRRL
jgi:hypothetical protein